MKVESWKTSRVKPYDGNPRKNEQAVAGVSESIRKFGFRQPIVVDSDGVIVVGHTRWKAAVKLGLATVPVHVAADLSPAQARAYRIADNRTNELAEWDPELLANEVEGLKADGFDWGELPSLDDLLPNPVPSDNKPIDEEAMKDTKNECPKCGFKW